MTPKKVVEKQELKSQPRMAAEDRRQQILEVAVELFSQKGFRGTTTKEIAQAAEVNEAIIFRHFATKSDLYDAIMDAKAKSASVQEMQNILDQAMEKGDDRKVFESLAFHIMNFHEHDDTAMRLLLYSALEGHELADMIVRNHISRTHRQLAEYVKKRISTGAFRKMDAMTAVRGFMGMIIGHVLHKKFFEKAGGDDLKISNRQAAEFFTDLFLTSMTAFDQDSGRQRRK